MNDAHDHLPDWQEDIRPWGDFKRFTLNRPSTVKLITVEAGEALSLQTHAHRDEYWYIVSGEGTVHIAGKDHHAAVGDSFFCSRGDQHRVTGGERGIAFIEVAFGDFDESDITRLEDQYGRV
ncbi:phosphomannose isomerase type II C-terminal cupin domain [Patescibacteria group bacterium]|nr:phosphomannose isomerase type II C-terminal cupin domain [Patescibacteria group bacterium]